MKDLKMTVAKPTNEATGKPGVPVDNWGTDHWATFGYLETRAVDYNGSIDLNHMRCDISRHPGLMNNANRSFPNSKHPTILKVGRLENHDDWDCFEDLIAMGLCTWEGTGIRPFVKLTTKGRGLAAILRKHKADGGKFGDFVWPEIIAK